MSNNSITRNYTSNFLFLAGTLILSLLMFYLPTSYSQVESEGSVENNTNNENFVSATDADGDGIPDDQPTGTTTDADGDGIPDDQPTGTTTDADGDGIPDDQPTGTTTDADGDGIPDDQTTGTTTDEDGDGTPYDQTTGNASTGTATTDLEQLMTPDQTQLSSPTTPPTTSTSTSQQKAPP